MAACLTKLIYLDILAEKMPAEVLMRGAVDYQGLCLTLAAPLLTQTRRRVKGTYRTLSNLNKVGNEYAVAVGLGLLTRFY